MVDQRAELAKKYRKVVFNVICDACNSTERVPLASVGGAIVQHMLANPTVKHHLLRVDMHRVVGPNELEWDVAMQAGLQKQKERRDAQSASEDDRLNIDGG